MSPFREPRKRKPNYDLAQISLLAAVPAILIAAPLIGYFLGHWADNKFGTDPYLMILGLVLGFAAAAREIFNLVRKSEELERRKEQNKNGT